MTKEFTITITEVLEREVDIVATSKAHALEIIEDLYRSGELVLDSEDLIDSSIG